MIVDPTSDIDLAVSDAQLVATVADQLAVPREEPADSFVLHAPLELLARGALLRFVPVDERDAARRRIAEMGPQFRAFGSEVGADRPEPAAWQVAGGLEGAAAALERAIDRGDLDDVDALASWLGRHARPDQLAALLADAVVARLAAAGHAPIFLWLFPRAAPHGDVTGELLRQLCRELARRPQWRLRWIDDLAADGHPAGHAGDQSTRDATAGLFDALANAPRLGRPSSTFIHPLMSRVDHGDLAGGLLGPWVGAASGRAITRAAAWSMVLDPGDDAPYGWSHCLTMPQAVLGVAAVCREPATALAVAATHVLGFRASLASGPIDVAEAADWAPTGLTVRESIEAGPTVARDTAWHLEQRRWRDAIAVLAGVAATHHDAHLVKHTLACIDAMSLDPAAARLHFASAAALAGWWAAHPEGIEIS